MAEFDWKYEKPNPYQRITATGLFMPHTEFYMIDQLLLVARKTAEAHIARAAVNPELFTGSENDPNGIQSAKNYIKRLDEWQAEWEKGKNS